MKIVVDVPDEEYESYALAITFGMGSTAIRRILNGTPLPKGHGALKDVDAIRESICESIEECVKWADEVKEGEMYARVSQSIGTFVECSLRIKNAPTIIEADKEYGVKAITRGNCMACGKELTEGVFFCKECEEKGRKEGAEE